MLVQSTDRGYCVVFLGKVLTLTVPLWYRQTVSQGQTDKKCWEVTCIRLASRPGGVSEYAWLLHAKEAPVYLATKLRLKRLLLYFYIILILKMNLINSPGVFLMKLIHP